MKKIYTLIAAMALTLTASAQYDLSIAYTAYADGDAITETGIDLSFSVTNESDVALTVDDTIWVSYTRDGAAVFVTNVNILGEQYIELTEELAPGASVGPFGPADLGVPTGFSEEFCCVVYGIGVASVTTTNDDNYADNVQCVSIDVETGFDVSIEDLNLDLSSVYMNAGQLVIVNDGASDDVQANLNIVSMNGQIVQTENFVLSSGTSYVDLNNLTTGIYIVAIETEQGVITKKISIQ